MKLLSQPSDLLRREPTPPKLVRLLLLCNFTHCIPLSCRQIVTLKVTMSMIGRHGSKPGHQVGVKAMSYGMLHGIDIPFCSTAGVMLASMKLSTS